MIMLIINKLLNIVIMIFCIDVIFKFFEYR